MNQSTKRRAAQTLLRCKTITCQFFPRIYVVGDNIVFFRNAALRWQDEIRKVHDVRLEVETLPFREAYFTLYGEYPTDEYFIENVQLKAHQEGELYNGHLFNPDIPKRKCRRCRK